MFKNKKFYTNLPYILIFWCVAISATASDFSGSEISYQEELICHDRLASQREEHFRNAHTQFTRIEKHDQILSGINALIAEYGAENISVYYDIDDCATYPDHAACLPESYSKTHKDTFNEHIKGLDPIQKSIVWNLKYRLPKSLLTDDALPDVLNTLKNAGVTTMGLTASMSGEVISPSDCQYEARCSILEKLGVQFNAPQQTIVFDEFPKFHRSHPVYHNGIGFTQTSQNHGSTTKGEFIVALEKQLNKRSKAVVLIDDSSSNLHRTAQTIRENGIAFVGYQFHSERVHTIRTISEANYSQYIKHLVNIARFTTHH